MTAENTEASNSSEVPAQEARAGAADSPRGQAVEPAPEEGSGLTPEQIAEYKRAQKRRMLIALVAGIILMIMGFLAGQNLIQMRNAASPDTSISVVPADAHNHHEVTS